MPLPAYETYKNKYLNEIFSWQRDKNLFRADEIYERLCALELGHILWRDLPPGFEDFFTLPHRNDYGVDSINLEYTETGQMKHYGANSMVTWTKITNFLSYSKEILGIHKLFLCVQPVAKIDSMVELMAQKKSNLSILRLDFNLLLQDLPCALVFEEDETKIGIQQRPYLVSTTEKILKNKNYDFKVQWPCGLGKTFLAYNLHKSSALKENEIDLFITPWISLAIQVVNECRKIGISAGLIGNGYHILQKEWKFVVCIRASIDKIIQIQPKVRYKILDEGHHYENEEKWAKLCASIASKKCVYLSATFHDPSKVNDRITIRDAITMGYICDYKIHLHYFSGDRLSAIKNFLKSNSDLFPAFVYFNSTEKAKKFAKELQKDNLRADFLIGTDSDTKKIRFKEQVENGLLDVGCLCGCMNEGETVYALKTVIFGDMRFSSINVRQVSQRGSRKNNSKPFYNIVFFIEKKVLDYNPRKNDHDDGNEEEENDEENDEENEYEDVRKIFKILTDEDPILKKSIAQKSFTRFRFVMDNKEVNDSDCEGVASSSLLYHQIFDSLGMMILDSRLSPEQKVQEFLKMEKYKEKCPSSRCKDTFSDGTKVGLFWHNCKNNRKCDNEPYKLILTNPVYKEEYERCKREKRSFTLSQQKVQEFLKMEKYKEKCPPSKCKDTFSDGTKVGVFWHNCKKDRRCDNEPYKLILTNPVYKEEYERFCKQEKRSFTLSPEQKVQEFLKMEKYKEKCPPQSCKDTFSDGTKVGLFWDNCKNYRRCDNEPYNLLLTNPVYKEEYDKRNSKKDGK